MKKDEEEILSNSTILADRPQNLSLSKWSKKFSLLVASLFTLWLIALFYLLAFDSQAYKLNTKFPVYGIIIILFAVIIIVIQSYFQKDDPFTIHYSPKQQASNYFKAMLPFALLSFALWAIAGYVVFVLLWPLSPFNTKENIFSCFFFIILCLAIPYTLKQRLNIYKTFKSNESNFGDSNLQIHNAQKLERDNKLFITLHNKNLENQEIEVTFRNTSELKRRKRHIKNKRIANSKREIGICFLSHFEEKQNYLFKNGKEIIFIIPKQETYATELTRNIIQYWELEFTNKTKTYFSRFILNIS